MDKATEEDIERGKAIPSDVCPRRYCYFWESSSFDWDRTPQQGCTYLHGKRPPVESANMPCCRCDSSSSFDHFEPMEPLAVADGVDYTKWLEVALKMNRRFLGGDRVQQDFAE